ncbi:MAG: hypothetical protein EPN14_00435 [Gallionella sp.]|nr:MAG: hypothetical protein EPN14_00435 [Gallionella sp.]
MKPAEFYDLLLDYAASPEPVREVVIGLVWSYCRAESIGLAMSPGGQTRTLPWAGTLRGKTLAELAGWLRDFEPYRATVGMAAANAAINRLQPKPDGVLLQPGAAGSNLVVFEHFLPQLRDHQVVVVGRYPGLDEFAATHGLRLTVLERQPGPNDMPDTACEYLLPEAEWVFLTAGSITNKTFPRLAELSRNAITVLMGPTTPWLPELYHFGIDYLAGMEIADAEQLRAVVCEGGGVRLFDGGVRYRVAALTRPAAQDWSRSLIAGTVREKETLLQAMADWYNRGHTARYPDYGQLDGVNRRLSRLDSCFKRLWDENSDALETKAYSATHRKRER